MVNAMSNVIVNSTFNGNVELNDKWICECNDKCNEKCIDEDNDTSSDISNDEFNKELWM